MTGEWTRQDIFTGISGKVIISVLLQRPSAHTGCFVYHCQAEFRVEISLSQQLTSVPCFLFFPPGHRWVRPVQVYFATQSDSQALWCFFFVVVVAVWCCFKVHIKPKPTGPPPSKRGPRGRSVPGRLFCPSQDVRGNRRNDQEDGKQQTGLPHMSAAFNHQLSSSVLQIQIIFLTKKNIITSMYEG